MNVAFDLHRSVAETRKRENKSKASKKKTTTFIEMFQISTTELGPPLPIDAKRPIHRDAYVLIYFVWIRVETFAYLFLPHAERETHQYTNTTDTLSSEKI